MIVLMWILGVFHPRLQNSLDIKRWDQVLRTSLFSETAYMTNAKVVLLLNLISFKKYIFSQRLRRDCVKIEIPSLGDLFCRLEDRWEIASHEILFSLNNRFLKCTFLPFVTPSLHVSLNDIRESGENLIQIWMLPINNLCCKVGLDHWDVNPIIYVLLLRELWFW